MSFDRTREFILLLQKIYLDLILVFALIRDLQAVLLRSPSNL
ncbi:hypothetical protein [Myxosarcina sp. GI1]|nr:hypothetical protein [Myxosarcina sp. GI1]